MYGRYLDISNGHLTKKDAETVLSNGLNLLDVGVYSYPHKEGAFITCANNDEADLERIGLEIPSLKPILEHCQKLDISLIRFDRDAPDMSSTFPLFDW